MYLRHYKRNEQKYEWIFSGMEIAAKTDKEHTAYHYNDWHRCISGIYNIFWLAKYQIMTKTEAFENLQYILVSRMSNHDEKPDFRTIFVKLIAA